MLKRLSASYQLVPNRTRQLYRLLHPGRECHEAIRHCVKPNRGGYGCNPVWIMREIPDPFKTTHNSPLQKLAHIRSWFRASPLEAQACASNSPLDPLHQLASRVLDFTREGMVESSPNPLVFLARVEIAKDLRRRGHNPTSTRTGLFLTTTAVFAYICEQLLFVSMRCVSQVRVKPHLRDSWPPLRM